MPAEQRLRVIALAVLIDRDHVLCAEGYDSVKQQRFFRPLGGEVEFGELAADAAVRELREELAVEIEIVESLGVQENLYTFDGAPGHEIVFEFVARFRDGAAPDTLDPIVAVEGDATFTARWLPLAEVIAGRYTVYPDDLSERLAAWTQR